MSSTIDADKLLKKMKQYPLSYRVQNDRGDIIAIQYKSISTVYDAIVKMIEESIIRDHDEESNEH